MEVDNKQFIENNYTPVKEYKAFHNFNLEKFYNISAPLAKEIYPLREDIDIPKGGLKSSQSIEDYIKKLIREPTQYESYIQSSTVNIAPENISNEEIITLESGIKTLSGEITQKEKPSKKGPIGAIIGAIVLIFIKFKALPVLLFTKFLPFLSHFFAIIFKSKGLLLTAGSMLITIAAYATVFPVELAAGLVLLIFVHEMGHAFVITLKGIRAGLPVFIPFFGAFIAIKDIPKDVVTEAQIALGGPLIGSIAALVMYQAYVMTGHQSLLFLAYVGFMLNLFNLTPVSPLDGGRIVAAISKKFWLIGFIILLGFTIVLKTPALIIILFFALANLLHRSQKDKEPSQNYYNASPAVKALFALIYFSLALFLGFATFETHSLLAAMQP